MRDQRPLLDFEKNVARKPKRSVAAFMAFAALSAFFACCGGAQAAPANASPYEIVWDSPSADTNGTMPLGNGEVAVNAWIEPSGDLRFFLARTDSWDDYGRLLKIGGVRVHIVNGMKPGTKTFRQRLTVRDATMTARFGEGNAEVFFRLWVDAHRPIVYVEARTLGPTEAVANIEMWRTERSTLSRVETSDIFAGQPGKTVVEPDTLLTGLDGSIGWYHRNTKSIGPELCAKIQGIGDFPRPDPLLGRTFGALIAAERPERKNNRTLQSKAGTYHLFEIGVHTKHPATAAQWQAEAQKILEAARTIPIGERRAAHEKWWASFWERSWIHISQNARPGKSSEGMGFPPANKLPVRLGMAQNDGSRFAGEFGRVSLYEAALGDEAVQQLASQGPKETTKVHPDRVYCGQPQGPRALPELAGRTFSRGLTVEAWIKPAEAHAKQEGRIVDKISVGGSDGFLLDIQPGRNLRAICAGTIFQQQNVLRLGTWQHVALTVTPAGRVAVFLNGRRLQFSNQQEGSLVADGDDAFVVSRAYALQRYVNACAGRGRYPIKFNGSIFTVPFPGGPGYADYRAWGPGYWWQNTRLPYHSMCASGDFDLLEPLFRMYAIDLLPLFSYRTQRHVGHEGAYIPECIYFWGDFFTETYGWEPCDRRVDKLQASRWHKWEWVSGLELAGLLLDRFEHTNDAEFLKTTVFPAVREILVFFDRHYKTGPDGKLYMHPAQALETWWDCVNPMPELAGLQAITARLLALPEVLTTSQQRTFWRQLQAKLPALPTVSSPRGKPMLAPAQVFRAKSNIENPELYAVFPFRQIALGKPNREWGLEALTHRRDRGPFGWRQEDIFMAYLGLADEARDYIVQRARHKHGPSRFPAFWGPNYDWVPDQCHGGVLLKAVQALLLQTDGQKIYLLPAWPRNWDADFKLHAPANTIVSGKVKDGKLSHLEVQPPGRRKDVILRSEK